MTAPRKPKRLPLSQPCPGRIRRWLRRGLFGATALGSLHASWLLAQEVPGLTLRFDIGQQIEASTNPDLITDPPRDRIIGRTKLGFSLASVTTNQQLSFGVGIDYEAGDFAGRIVDDSRISNRRLSFGYTRETRNALIDLRASYSRTPVSDIEGFDEFTGEDLLLSGGERSNSSIGLSIETGREAPVGFSLSASRSAIRYLDQPVGGSSSDRDIWNLDGGLRLSVSPVLDVTLQAGKSGNSYDDARNYTTDQRYTGIALRYEVDPALRLTGGLQYSRIETSQNVGPLHVSDTTEGFGGNIGFELDRPNGVIGGSLSTELYDTGRRDTLMLSRAMELRSGELAGTVSLVDTEAGGNHVLFGANYRHDMKRGSLRLSATQQVTSDEDEEAIRSQASVNWRGELTEVSAWNAGLSISDYDVISGTGNDTRRTNLTLGYTHDLTEDWALSTGYTHTLSQSDSRGDRDDDRIFLGLQSSFTFLP